MYTVLIKWKYKPLPGAATSKNRVKYSQIVKVKDLTNLNDSDKQITSIKILEFKDPTDGMHLKEGVVNIDDIFKEANKCNEVNEIEKLINSLKQFEL